MRQRNPVLNADRRKSILQAATQCFVKNGFHGTSMKDVCLAANMSPGTLYHYFASKTEIIAGIIAEEGEFMGGLLAPLHEGQRFLEALFGILDVIALEVSETDLALHTEIAAEIQRQPHLRRQQLVLEEETSNLIIQSLTRAQEAGEIDPGLDPADAARIIIAIIDGLLWRATREGARRLEAHMPAAKQALKRMLVAPAKAS